MRIVEKIVDNYMENIADKNVLEIACGDSTMSLECSKYAKTVLGTDIDLSRSNKIIDKPQNLKFIEYDATKIDKLKYQADTIICYNGVGHMEPLIDQLIDACYRKMNHTTTLLFINTWKVDKKIVASKLLKVVENHKGLNGVLKTSSYYQALEICLVN